MTEEEWFETGANRLDEWNQHVRSFVPGYDTPLTDNEVSAFEYAWELAGREMGIVK